MGVSGACTYRLTFLADPIFAVIPERPFSSLTTTTLSVKSCANSSNTPTSTLLLVRVAASLPNKSCHADTEVPTQQAS